RPLLGDFLAAASEHIDVATNGVPQLPAETASAVVKELGRLTTVMARCAGAFAIDDQADPTCPLDAGALAVQDARAALRHAAARRGRGGRPGRRCAVRPRVPAQP